MSKVLTFPTKKKPAFDNMQSYDAVRMPTDDQISGFLTTLDYLRSLGTDDDCDIQLRSGEVFLKVHSYHDHMLANGVESAVKMEKVASATLYDEADDLMIGDLITKQNIELIKTLLTRVSISDTQGDEIN